MKKNILFYALREDLLPVLELVESKTALKYTRTGNFLRSQIKDGIQGFSTATEIPNLGKASADSSGTCEAFLICERETPINLRTVGKMGERVCVDQLINPDSVAFHPGGIWNEDVVLEGGITTVSESQVSQALMNQFQTAINNAFTRVRGYYIGPGALALLEGGKRLTSAVQSPPEGDLPPPGPSARPSAERATRVSYEESCMFLQRVGLAESGAEGLIPPMRDHRPRYDDAAAIGITFFRTWLGFDERNLENLTLPRTYIGRSDVGPVSFKNTDLSESTLCWNDFDEVDFTDADLSECDLRASIFRQVRFVRTDLRNADLRRSGFEACDFTDADMRGAELTRTQGEQINLSDQQRTVIDWQENDGDVPPGG
jgi:hypothetical protein